MKVIPNIVPIFQLLSSGKVIGKYKKEISRAKEAGDEKKEAELIREAANSWGNYLVDKYQIKVVVKNEEKIPEVGGIVYVANHQSYLDVVTLYSVLKTQAGFIAKSEFGKVPFLRLWIERLRGIFITRGNPRESLKTVYEAKAYLDAGFSIVVFPEGTRSKSDKVSRFKPGTFKFATKSGAPIVPITIDGAYKVYEGTGVLTKNVEVTITFHDPIETKNLKRDDILALPERVENIVKQGFNN